MKKFISYIGLGIIAIILSIGIALGVSIQLSTQTIAKIEENTEEALDCSPDPIIVYDEEQVASDLFRPKMYLQGGKLVEIYCVEPGAPLSTAAANGNLREDVQAYVGRTYSAGCGCPSVPYLRSLPYYYCHGEHYTESSTSVYGKSVPDLYDVGYIASYYPNGYQSQITGESWSGGKQQALWMSPMSELGDPMRGSYRAQGEIIRKDSLFYQEFYQKIMEQDSQGRIGMKPVDNTNVDEVKLDTDNTTKTHILGPFKVDYVNGRYGMKSSQNIAFGGISDMYLYDEHGTRIEITHFIFPDQEESYVTPNYFSTWDRKYPDIQNPNMVDYYDQPSAQFDGRRYPAPNEEFYVEFDYTGDESSALKLHIDFQYMQTEILVCKRNGQYFETAYSHSHSYHEHCNENGCSPCHSCTTTIYEGSVHQQNLLFVYKAERRIIEEGIDIPLPPDIYLGKTMKLGGYVYEDMPAGKEQQTSGVKDDQDLIVPGAKVTLYELDENGQPQLATLAPLKEEDPGATDAEINDPNDYKRRINPTLTDENGYYEFRGLDTEKKYFVMFTYNGQTYLPTEYLTNTTSGETYNSVQDMVNAGKYDTGTNTSDIWRQTSKAQEVASQREAFDNRFKEIRSYPENYKMNPDGLSLISGSNGYNVAFSTYDLMGFELTENGTYTQIHEPLIDSYLYLENGVIMEGKNNADGSANANAGIKEGLITKKIREFIEQNKKYPTDEEMKSDIYSSVVSEISGSLDGGSDEAWQMMQFIEDCKINAYTISNPSSDTSYDKYPVYEQFTTYVASGNKYPNNSYSNGTHDPNASTYEDHIVRKNEQYITFKNVYQGQLFVNCGLWRRQEADMAVRKDVYKATLKINDKTVIYNYDKRTANMGDGEGTNNADGNQDNKTYWDINIRMSDYNSYYAQSYSEDGQPGYMREIYETDYLFGTDLAADHPGDPLEIYVTYQITVRNQSMSILTEIEEVVDYYDQDYTFKPNLSWVMYRENDNEAPPRVNEDQYYSVMESNQEEMDSVSVIGRIDGAREVQASEDSTQKYPGTEKNLGNGYQNVYINGLQDKKLASGESAYIYLTFQVNKQSNRVILDGGTHATSDTPKENIAEVNGFTTYYKDGTTLPNHVSKGSGDIAGLIDRDSTPGNLVEKDLEGDKYEQNFEDDTDRAPSLRVRIDDDAIRKANGIVWEDERTENVDGALIGDGIRQEDETPVAGVTVELIEKCVDGTEYNWGQATTNGNGHYEFAEYIPGDYIIRFKYGNTDATALSTQSKGSQGSNIVSYNGQDFKSTTYQDGIEQSEFTDLSRRYQGYRNTATQNITAKYNDRENAGNPTEDTFGYDIYASDEATANGENYSDAKDLWTAEGRGDLHGRDSVISYSQSNVTNHKAEVLASPYEVPTYNGTEYSDDEMRALYEELKTNTQMTAETGMIVVEFEYDRQQTDGLNSTINDETNSSKNYIVLDGEDNRQNSNYTLNNIDFGLTERPKAQLEIDKSVANVKVTLANGSILFDINEAANNALWQDHKEYSIDEHMRDGMYEEYYGSGNKHRYSFREEIDNDVAKTDKGLIQLTMDEELMHGATIQITYTVKITNVGETDYYDTGDAKNYYYLGNRDGSDVVTTTANQVVDYVQNNLQFNQNDEAYLENGQGVNKRHGWGLITTDNLTAQNLVNNKLTENLKQFNTIVQTENFGTDNLVPGQETWRNIVLSQLITPENTDDDLTYGNMVEIVKTSNTVGRRMAYSVVGNQDPSAEDASEVDANIAERIVILPPFGEVRIYYILGAVVAVMLIGGIILIRRKVLKGKDKTE